MRDVYSLKDFREVKNVYLKEVLTEEEIMEGFEPIEEIFKVCITGHAYKRMFTEFNRYCEYSLVEDLLIDKSNELLNCSMNEEFVIMNEDSTLAVVSKLQRIDGELSIVIITVIRKIYIEDGVEKTKKVWMRGDTNII